jgi:flagellar protein FliS
MTTAHAARSRYATDNLATASPARLLVMLYDRLVRDLVLAEQATREGRFATSSAELVHAQAIVLELRTNLKPDLWDGAAGLSSLYTWLYSELLTANVRKDADKIATCRALVEPLRDAWREAAMQAVQQPA